MRSKGINALLTAVSEMGAKLMRPLRRKTSPRILVLEPDPFIAFLIHLDHPEAEVIEADPDWDIEELSLEDWDLVIIDGADPRASMMAKDSAAKLVGLGPTVESKELFQHTVDRPVVPSSLHSAVREALGISTPADLLADFPLSKAETPLKWARVIGLLIAAIVEVLWASGGSHRPVVFAAVAAYVAARLVPMRSTPMLAWLDVSMAAGAMLATGGTGSSYVVLGLVASLEVGMMLGIRRAAWAVGLLVATSIPWLLGVVSGGPTKGQTLAGLLLIAFAGLAAALFAGIVSVQKRNTTVISEANRTLSVLYHLVRAVPGGLDVSTVSAAAIEEVQEALGSPAAVVLVAESNVLNVCASEGLHWDAQLTLQRESPALERVLNGHVRVLHADQVDASVARLFAEHSCWLAAPLRHGKARLGVLLAVCTDEDKHDANRLLLQQIADDTALAIENAQLFARVQELALDEERERLARELHDGLAQSLTYLRVEMELMARRGVRDPQSLSEGLARLVDLLDESVEEVRSTVLGLRSAITSEGLSGSIRSYLRDIRSAAGPQMIFESSGAADLPPHIETEMFRIAQIAVSNALRHSNAKNVKVLLEGQPNQVALFVEDDAPPQSLVSEWEKRAIEVMEEQANGIGATLSHTQQPFLGTRVELRLTPSIGEEKR